MYKIIHISSGIVAATFNERAFALDWLAENNNLLGEPANLYKIVKAVPWKHINAFAATLHINFLVVAGFAIVTTQLRM